jgi:hypothetical protein
VSIEDSVSVMNSTACCKVILLGKGRKRSPFAVRRSPFTVRRSPFTVHRSPFNVRSAESSATLLGQGIGNACGFTFAFAVRGTIWHLFRNHITFNLIVVLVDILWMVLRNLTLLNDAESLREKLLGT